MASLKIYHGKENPLIAIGKNQVRLLSFAAKYPSWHYHANDKATLRAINGLIARGSIVKNRFGQFAIAYGQFKKELES